MPRNGSGVYTLPSGNPVVPGTVIEAAWANDTLEDIANELTNSLSRTGAGGMIAPFRIADGNVSAPGIAYLNETGTGLYRAGSGSVWMSVLGVNTVQFSTVGLTIPSGKALTAQGNATVGGTLGVTGAATLSSTLAVTGAITASSGVLGNVTAASGTSTFNNVTINGDLDMNAGSSGTITNLPNPTNSGDAANKAYVDAQAALRLALTGGTMTGAIAMSTNKITGLGTPTADADAATKAYVDNVAQGIDAKASCRAATTTNITLSGAQTIDGVAVIAGDRVLVKDQSTASQNGIYVAAAGAWSRSSDADSWAELVAAFTFVEEGTTNGNNGYICTVSAGGTLGSTAVTWAQFSGAGQINAGTGMTKTGNTLNVNTASSSRIVVGADEIDLATTGVVASTYRSVTVDQWGRVTAGTNPTTLAGYGISDAYTQTQVDNFLAAKLNLSGGTMTGALAMGTNKITGLGDPTNAQDAATKNYIDTVFGSTTSAAASAAAAASSASAASASASSASGSATAAAGSATSAAASYTAFDNQYLGSKSSDPTVNNTGGALVEGNLYWNSSSNQMRVYDGSAWVAAYIPAAGYAQLGATNTFTANQIISANTSSAALAITQAGSGNALYIEDVAADATPFVVSSTGAVGIGTTTPDNVTSAGIALVSNDGYYPQVVNRNKSNDTTASYLVFDKDRAGAIVQNGDALGAIVWRSFDGANYLQSSAIIGYSAGTPGTNDVPGSLSFFTTADGAASPSERLTIGSTGALAVNGSYGTSGQVLTSAGSGAAPTWTTPATNGATFTAVASGSLTNGRMVNLKSDGTVEMVKETTTTYPDSIPAGSTTQFNAGVNATYYAVAWNESVSSQFLLVYYDTSDSRGKAVVGTVSGTSISFGTETQVNGNAPFESPSVCCVPGTNDRYVIVWRGYQERGRSVVASVSGTSVSMGTEYTFTTSTSVYATCVASVWADSGKVVASYFDNSNGNYATCIVGSVSGTDVSWGNRVVVNSSDSLGATSIAFSKAASNSTGIVIYRKNGDGNGYGKVVTVSGSTLSSGTEATWNSAGNANSDYTGNGMFISAAQTGATYQYAIVNKDATTSYGYIYGATTSGTTITFSSGVAFESNALTSPPRIGFNKYTPSGLVVSYATASATYGYSMSMSGTTVTLGTKNTVYAGTSSYAAVGFSNSDTTARTLVIAYRGASNVPYAVVGTTGYSVTTNNLSSTLFVGASAGDYANGDTATVYVKGAVSTAQSGLTVNSTYYLQTNGTLSTTPGSPSVLAGRALAATKILIGTT